MDDTAICARCKYFPLPATGRAAQPGRCEGYERPATWSDQPRPCVLYGRPKGLQERQRRENHIRDMEARHAGTQNAVDAAPGT